MEKIYRRSRNNPILFLNVVINWNTKVYSLTDRLDNFVWSEHSVGLATSRLPVDEDSSVVSVDDIVQKMLGGKKVDLFLNVFRKEKMVESEVRPFEGTRPRVSQHDDVVTQRIIGVLVALIASKSESNEDR